MVSGDLLGDGGHNNVILMLCETLTEWKSESITDGPTYLYRLTAGYVLQMLAHLKMREIVGNKVLSIVL